MKLLYLFILFSAALWSQDPPTDLSQTGKPATIKVLLAHDIPRALIEVKGNYQIVDPATNLEITRGSANRRGWVSCNENGIDWGEVFPSIRHIRIVPLDAHSSVLVDGIHYRGCLEICQVEKLLQIVNEVDVESYLKSTLAFQIEGHLHDEVLQALAVIARTDAYYKAIKNAHAFWHVDAKSVGYTGYGITFQNLPVDRSIERTSRVILTYENTPFAATWTANSAGATAPFSAIFRKNTPSPAGVAAPLAAKIREKSRWSLHIPAEELSGALQIPPIEDVQTFTDKQSRKVYALRLKATGKAADISFIDLQKILGAQKLKSSDFTVELKDGLLLFYGYGEGCGTGLCLYSAEQMAEQGISAKTILLEFFPGTQTLITP